MDRRASDNKYLHRDFHNGMNFGVDYIAKNYGEDGLEEYLSGFARTYHAPLIAAIREKGLSAMEEYLKGIYEIEEASDDVETELSGGVLNVYVKESPAIAHIKKSGDPISKWFVETTNTVYGTIAREAGVGFELLSYDSETGEARFRFTA